MQEIRVIWRCQECIQESGPTRCSFARYQVNRIGTDVKSKITQSLQRQKARFDLSSLRSHDTKDGYVTGLIHDMTVHMEHTIEHVIKRQIVSVHPDGYCLFRALGKNHSIHPGMVIKYMKNKCKQMIRSNDKMKLESNAGWYTKWANKTKEWTNIKSNISSHCNRTQWGGINEIQIWAMIIKQKVIILDCKLDTATIFLPIGDTLPMTVNLERLNNMHNTDNRQNKKSQYILYNGSDHYNSIPAEDTTGVKTRNEITTHNQVRYKSKLRRKIEQNRNKRIKKFST